MPLILGFDTNDCVHRRRAATDIKNTWQAFRELTINTTGKRNFKCAKIFGEAAEQTVKIGIFQPCYTGDFKYMIFIDANVIAEKLAKGPFFSAYVR